MAKRPRIQASDVVFMYAPEPFQYDAYQGTVTTWGGRANSRLTNEIERFRAQVNEAKRRQMRYCASVDFLVDFGGFIDFRPANFMDAVCRDLDDKPITVPWLHDLRHKGHPAYWFCSNNPDYRAYLRDQTERACSTPIDGLHIDDWRGTAAAAQWFGGCFCEHCRRAFRVWLSQNTELLNASERDAFDYRTYLREKGITAEQFRRNPRSCPLGEQFLRFQAQATKAIVGEIFEYAERLARKPLLRSVNSAASSYESLLVAEQLDYFCGEIDHHASADKLSVEPMFVYRLVENLDKRQTATASGWDWAYIAANQKPGLVKTWIVQSYAFGSMLMVPHNQWCYTPEKGTHWWKGKPEDFAPLYRFVRERRAFFDDYVSQASVAVLCNRQTFDKAKQIAFALLEANIPFDMLYDEPSEPLVATPEMRRRYRRYRYVIRASNAVQASAQPARWIDWEGIERLPTEVRNLLAVTSEKPFVVSLRRHARLMGQPIVCHILNRSYSRERDDVDPARVRVSIATALLPSGQGIPRQAELFAVSKSAQRVPIRRQGDQLVFEVPEAGLWTLAVLR